MKTIYKYPIEIVDKQIIKFDRSKVVHVGLDPQGTPCIWAEYCSIYPPSDHFVYIIGTGNPMPEITLRHIGSFIQGPFVWHVYI